MKRLPGSKAFRNWRIVLGTFFGSTVLWSIFAHIGLFSVAALVVAVPYKRVHELFFESKVPVKAVKRDQDHRASAARYSNLDDPGGGNPTPMSPRLAVSSEAALSLPEMPSFSTGMQSAPNSSSLLANLPFSASASPLDAEGAASPAGSESGSAEEAGFFGIRDHGESIVLMIDISASMFVRGGQDRFQLVRDEAIRLIQGLGPEIQFGMIKWSGGAYRWKEELAYAEKAHRESAVRWIQNLRQGGAPPQKGNPDGTRHDLALQEAFALEPDVIYLISDGNAKAGNKRIAPETLYNLTRRLQAKLKTPARLHGVYYVTSLEKEEEKQWLAGLAAQNQGQFRAVEGSGR